MKKHYCAAVINEDAGEAQHVIVSDMPLTDEQIQTIPEPHHISFFEFETPGNFARARVVLDSIEVSGVDLAAKKLPNSKIKLRAGKGFSKMVIGISRKRK